MTMETRLAALVADARARAQDTAPTARPLARLWEERGRLCVAFDDRRGYPQWGAMMADWRRTFVDGPRLAHWRYGGQCWSLRKTARERLMVWLEVWHIDVTEGQRGLRGTCLDCRGPCRAVSLRCQACRRAAESRRAKAVIARREEGRE